MFDVIVVGAGPAGLTAALYTGRSKLKTKILEKSGIGGQLLLTDAIENYPGIYQMKSNIWVESAQKQLHDLKEVEIQEDAEVEKIEEKDGFFRVFFFSEGSALKATADTKSVIVATGAVPKRLGIKGEESLTGRGISTCATCDGPLFKDKEIAVIGGGDTAIEETLYLRKFAKKVTVIHRRDALRATALLQERVMKDPGISFKWNSVPLEVIGKARVEGLKIKNTSNNAEEVVPCEGVFVFIGIAPDTDFLKGFLDLNKDGYVVTDEIMMSSYEGIFACGDCRARPFKQVVTACGEGAIAAYSAAKFLEDKI